MAKPGDMEKLNTCLGILDSTDLGVSLVWLWTWSLIKDMMDDTTYRVNYSEQEIWDMLLTKIDSGHGFSLEYGAETHYEDVREWLFDEEIMTDLMFEEGE